MRKVHLIGYAHLDPVWLWKKSDGLSEVKATFRSALDRMKEFPGYIFTSASAAYYEWIEQVDIDMFNEIKARAAEGRWSVTGGFWIQPDCNIPTGESFARHLLYSQRYFKNKLGIMATVGYNVDSFGHNGMLPQIYSKAGINSYVFMRPDEKEKPEIPGNLFTWESPDGSRITVFRIWQTYATWDYSENNVDPADYRKALAHLEKTREDNHPYLCFYGIGNHGGGPTVYGLEALTALCGKEKSIVFSTVDEFFNDLKQIDKNLPIVRDDLQHHASGCYSANAAIKTANRRAEHSLIAAEKYDLMAGVLLKTKSENSKIQSAWEKVMFNQFHDIITGCSIREAYDEALSEYGAAISVANDITSLAAQRISWKVKTTGIFDKISRKNAWVLWEKQGEGAPVVVFNPHSFPINAPIQINTQVSGVKDHEGIPTPVQRIRGPQTNGGDRFASLFMANLPAWGYATYFLYKDEIFETPPTDLLKAEGTTLENDHLRVVFDGQTGCITSFFDKTESKELAKSPMARPIIINDEKSDTWAHGIFVFDEEVGMFANAEITITDNGPIRAGIRVKSKYNKSVLIQDFYLYPGQKFLEARCLLDFHEPLKILKLSFPVNVKNPSAIYSMPYGFIQKNTDGREQPSHEWMGLCNNEDGYGLALINNSKYSFSAKDSDMRMIAARGTIYADHYGERDEFVTYQDQGEQFFNYILSPYNQNNAADIVQTAAIFNQSPEPIMETHHDGPLPPRYSGINISKSNVIIQVVKWAEDQPGDENTNIILRVMETAGHQTQADISFLSHKFSVDIKPQEVKTLLLKSCGNIAEVLLTEMD